MTVADYDALAGAYANHLAGELAAKPFDRAWLDGFAARWSRRGPVGDIGCGPGHVAAYLAARAVEVLGIDLSPNMVAEAGRRHPGLRFEQGDMLDLGDPPRRFFGLVVFYALAHFDDAMLNEALRALHAALIPGGELLVAVHLGEAPLRPGTMWGVKVSLEFRLFSKAAITRAVTAAGFRLEEVATRSPYPGVEPATRRLYPRARA